MRREGNREGTRGKREEETGAFQNSPGPGTHLTGFMIRMDIARNGVVMIQDMEGMSWKHVDMKFQKRMLEIYQVSCSLDASLCHPSSSFFSRTISHFD